MSKKKQENDEQQKKVEEVQEKGENDNENNGFELQEYTFLVKRRRRMEDEGNWRQAFLCKLMYCTLSVADLDSEKRKRQGQILA